jgi:hypothetical protein
MDFSTSASRSAALADEVELGRGKAGASGTLRPPTFVDAGGTLPAIHKAKMSEPGTLPAEA